MSIGKSSWVLCTFALCVGLVACGDDANYAQLADQAATHTRLYPGVCSSTATSGSVVSYEYDSAERLIRKTQTGPSSVAPDLTVYTYPEDGVRRADYYYKSATPTETPSKVTVDHFDTDGNLVGSDVYTEEPFEVRDTSDVLEYTDGHLTTQTTYVDPDGDVRPSRRQTWEYDEQGRIAASAIEVPPGDDPVVGSWRYSTAEGDLIVARFEWVDRGDVVRSGEEVRDAFGNLLQSTTNWFDLHTTTEYSYDCFL